MKTDSPDIKNPNVGRRSKQERMTPTALKEMSLEIVADALYYTKREIKNMSNRERIDIIKTILPNVIMEDTQTTEDATMELLCKKALEVSIRVKKANEMVEEKSD